MQIDVEQVPSDESDKACQASQGNSHQNDRRKARDHQALDSLKQPMTSIASISRIPEIPDPAATADPTAEASKIAATSGAPWRITTRPVAAPDRGRGSHLPGKQAELDGKRHADRDSHEYC